MRRRQFLKQFAAAPTAVSCSQFLSYFLNFGLDFNPRSSAMAADKIAEADNPHFLIYWFVEGGWMGYDMFNPVQSPNNVVKRLESPSQEHYRVLKWGDEAHGIKTQGNIRYGYLAEDGKSIFPEMAVLSSMHTGAFHSGERLKAHMGDYSFRLTDDRQEDERSVMQAFAEVFGQPYLLPNVSWHWWLSDGELNEAQYTGRKGYYHALGPSHAHTIYAGTPEKLREFLLRMRSMSTDAVNMRVQEFLDGVDHHLLSDGSSEVVKSYLSARAIYQNLARRGATLDPALLKVFFNDPKLKEDFKIKPADELITYRSVNGNKARSKYSPSANVQAMMTFELMRAGYSNAFWIETRGIRDFDHHYSRRALWQGDGVTPVGMPDTTGKMREELWDPLKTLVAKLKATQYKDTGKSLFDFTTIVLTSEFGRTIHGDVQAIEKMSIPETEKKKMILDQDISQHWMVTSAAFLGGNVKGDAQYGRIGENTLLAIPIMSDGSLDPNYDPVTGELMKDRSKHEKSFIPNHGDVYATALRLNGVNPKGHGRNSRPPLEFIGRG